MSDIPTQAQSRGAHSSDDDSSYDTADFEVGESDAAYESDAPYDSDAAHDAPFEPQGDYVDPPSGVDLDSDPFADDLTKELAHAAPKTWFNRTTMVIGGLVLIVGGFLGGIQVQKHYGSSASTNTLANARANAASLFGRGGEGGTGGFGGTGGTGGFGGTGGTGTTGGAGRGTATAAAAQTGKITLVDGSTIYVTLANGNVLIVKTNSSTKVSVSTTSKVSALKAGETVSIGGTPDSSGNVTATSVTATK
jgi:Domain of unknown function (DUF5666)